MSIRKQLAGLVVALAFLVAPALVLADGHADDSWKIEVDGKSKSKGVIGFKLTFTADKAGTTADPVTIDVAVPEKTKKKDIAEMISNSLRGILGDEDFKIKIDDHNVKVKAKGDTKKFVLELTNNTVQGVSIDVDD